MRIRSWQVYLRLMRPGCLRCLLRPREEYLRELQWRETGIGFFFASPSATFIYLFVSLVSMTSKKGRNGNVRTIHYKTPDGTAVYIGPWPSAQKTTDAPIADIPPSASAAPVPTPPPVQRYGEPLERMARGYLTPSPVSSSPSPTPEPVAVPQPSHLEQAVAGLGQAKDALADVHKGLSSIATIGTYTTTGLVTGIGFGALAYNLMDNPRSVSASLFVGGLCTVAGVALGWYKAHSLQR